MGSLEKIKKFGISTERFAVFKPYKFESSALAFVCFEISTLLKLEISTLLKLEISSFRRIEISKQTNAKADESNL